MDQSGITTRSSRPLIRAVVGAVPPAPALVALARFTYEVGSSFGPAAGPGPVVFHTEAGRLTFRAEGPVVLAESQGTGVAEGKVIPPGTTFEVSPGDQLLVPGNTPHTARSSGTTAAAVLGVAMFPQVPPQEFPPGIRFIPLVLGMTNVLPPVPVLVSLDRLVYPAGGSGTFSCSGPAMVQAESGAPQCLVSAGGVQVTRAATGGPFGAPETTVPGVSFGLAEGDGLFLAPGAVVTLRDSGGGSFVVLQASTAPETSQSRKALARRYFYEVWSGGDLSVLEGLVAPGFVQHNPLGGQLPGPEGLRQFVARWHAAFPDGSVSVDLCVAQGEKVAARWRARGTHRQSFLGIPAAGRALDVSGITLFRISTGMIREAWQEWDQAGLLAQLAPGPTSPKAG